jgi:hypothetical protein
MCDLTLEALGFTADEARVARRAYDLTHTPEQRADALRHILGRSSDGGWQRIQAPFDTPHVEKAA